MSLAQANNYLTVSLHRLLAEEKGNVFFSPFSISAAMAMLLCAAEGETESEMRAALGHDHAGMEKKNVATVFERQLSALLENSDSYTLNCANSMLSQKGFEVKEGYKKILIDSFKALVLEADFEAESEKTVNQINQWVKEKTNNMIPKLVNSLDTNTVMVLLNAVYFKGSWKEKFHVEGTYPDFFYNGGSADNAKEIDMMHMTESFPFYEDDDLQVLQLPYVGEDVSMFVLLPLAKDGLESVESKLSHSLVQDLKKKLQKREVEVIFPRFCLEYQQSLVPHFKKLGIGKAFYRGAEFGIASDSPDLVVSDIVHKAVLEVHEEGSEAAAITMEVSEAISAKIIFYQFNADHPFVFVICDTRSDLILFMGRVNEL